MCHWQLVEDGITNQPAFDKLRQTAFKVRHYDPYNDCFDCTVLFIFDKTFCFEKNTVFVFYVLAVACCLLSVAILAATG